MVVEATAKRLTFGMLLYIYAPRALEDMSAFLPNETRDWAAAALQEVPNTTVAGEQRSSQKSLCSIFF